MQRIKLILADGDSIYVERLADFINTEFSSRIKVTACTRKSMLEHYLRISSEEVDILLAHPDFIELARDDRKIKLFVNLCDSGSVQQNNDLQSVDKYQLADQLVNQVLDLYNKAGYVQPIGTECKNTRIVSVYSPAGGTGKTTVSLGLAASLAHMGHDVLCLSMETLSSLTFALTSLGRDGFTKVLLSLEDKPNFFTPMIEMHKTRDQHYNFDFLEPPHCFLELSEVDTVKLNFALDTLAKGSKYDFVIVDMDSCANEKTLAVIEHSHTVVFLETDDCMCKAKSESFLNQAGKTGISEGRQFLDKILLVKNKSDKSVEPGLEQDEATGLKTCCNLPYIQNIWHESEGKLWFDPEGIMMGSLSGLVLEISKAGTSINQEGASG